MDHRHRNVAVVMGIAPPTRRSRVTITAFIRTSFRIHSDDALVGEEFYEALISSGGENSAPKSLAGP